MPRSRPAGGHRRHRRVLNHAPHIYAAAILTLLAKGILVPVGLEQMVARVGIRQEIEPILNVPMSVVISGGLTLVGCC